MLFHHCHFLMIIIFFPFLLQKLLMEVPLCMLHPLLQLEAHKNLVDQCVQGEGLVQVNVQIKTDGNIKKINIVDVLKPAEEYVEIAEEQCKSLSKLSSLIQ